MTTRIKLRRDTAANWLSANPILSAGEPGLETDTGKVKYGDGVTAWTLLPHNGGDALSSDTAIQVTTGDAERWLVRLRREDDDGTASDRGVFVQNVMYDNEGNVIVTAIVDLNNDGMAIFKFNQAGNLIWKWAVEDYGSGIYAQGAMAVDSNNDIWFTIWPDNPVCGLLKLNGADGSILFTTVFVNSDIGGASTASIAVDSNDDIIMCGSVGGDGGPTVIAVMKVVGTGNDIGTIQWQKQVLPEGVFSAGLGVTVDYNDNVIIAGTANNGDMVNKLVVVKFDSTGDTDWQQYIELDANSSGYGSAVVADAVGNIYVTGTLKVKNPGADNGPFQSIASNAVIIASLDPMGAVNWSRRVGPGDCSWVGTSIDVGDDGDLYLVASTVQLKKNQENSGWWDPSIVLARYDAQTGQVRWQKYWNNPNAQDIPAGNSSNDQWTFDNESAWAGRGVSVYKDKVVIGGATRMGANDIESSAFNSDVNYFNQGFLAQFDTDASEFNQDGYMLETSRVPGKLETGVHTVVADMVIQNSLTFSPGDLTGLQLRKANISIRKNATKSNTWTFERNGDLNTPADTSIKLNQTQLGYINMYGEFINYDDDVWYQSVVRDDEGFVYTLGSNDFGNNYPYVTKFDPEGNKVWEWVLTSGSNAYFYISWDNGVYNVEYIDSSGDGYKVGDKITLGGYQIGGGANYNNNLVLNVDSINSYGGDVGGVASVSIVSGTAPAGSGSTYVDDYYGIGQGDLVGITLDPKSKNLVVAVTIPTWGGNDMDSTWTQSLLCFVDSGSGALLNTKVLSDNGDIYVNDVAVSANGVEAVAGQKYNEYLLLTANGISVLSGSTTNTLFMAKSDFTSENIPGDGTLSYWDCWVQGSNITDQVEINNINRYTGLATTTREGSGAEFSITDNGNGTYAVTAISNGGTNYLVGHKIKILGSSLGGATPANDAIITVTGVASGLIDTASITGTGAGTDAMNPTLYTAVTGTNYNVGSGAVMELYFNFDGTYSSWNYSQYGSNYVIGDVLTIAGTNFAGGTSPANDVTLTVTNNANNNAGVSDFDTTGVTVPSDYIAFSTYGEVDYSAGTDYTIRQNLGGEAFVWRPGWEIAIGGPSADAYYSLTYCSDDSIVAVGYGRYEVNYDQGLVVKFDSNGSILWSNQINSDSYDMYNYSVAALSDDSVVVASSGYHSNYGNYVITVTRVDTDGSIVWQNSFYTDDDGYPDAPSIAVDTATNEIVLTYGAYLYDNHNNGEDSIYILKLDQDGEVLWKRALSVYNNTVYQMWNDVGGRAVSISGDKFTLAGYTYATADDYSNAVVATLPLDGTGTGVHGIWQYFEIEDYKVVQIRNSTTEAAFTPHVNTLNLTVDDSEQYYSSWAQDNFNMFTEVIRDERGGALEFADGSKQAFSATVIPQIKPFGDYTVRLEDSGKHIYVADDGNGYTIRIPHWQFVALPVGFTLTIVNRSNSTIYLEFNGGYGPTGNFYFSGGNTQTQAVGINDNGSGQMVTIMKVEEGSNTEDGDNHGDRWMIAGADIYDNW